MQCDVCRCTLLSCQCPEGPTNELLEDGTVVSESQPGCLRFAGLLGHLFAVVTKSKDLTLNPDGWRTGAECTSLEQAKDHAEPDDRIFARFHSPNEREYLHNQWKELLPA